MAPARILFYTTQSGCRFGEKCSFAHRQVDEQRTKRFKKNDDKSAVAMLKKNEHHYRTRRLDKNAYSSNTRQLGCVFSRNGAAEVFLHRFYGRAQTYGNRSDVFRYNKAVVRHADIRDQNPSLGMICSGELHQRNTNAPKL